MPAADEERRAAVIRALVEFSHPLAELQAQVATLPWDSEYELAELTAADVVDVLRRFVHGELEATDLEEWANLIESREDIGFEASRDEQLADFVFEAANQALNGPITLGWAEIWMHRLG